MKCLEFKRLALSDPNSKDVSFIEHAENCPDCLKYIGGVKEMDFKLVSSLDVDVPEELIARLELNQLLEADRTESKGFMWYAKVASFAAVLFVSGFLVKGQFLSNESREPLVASTQAADEMIMKLINHIEDSPLAPVWESGQANKTISTLAATYDPDLKFKLLDKLQFVRICPMDKQYAALHANLETDHGQTSFAYIKGYPVGEASDGSYKGYMTRIKPIRGGSLVIVSYNMTAMDEAEAELDSAIYWDI